MLWGMAPIALGPAHWRLMIVLTVARVIDVMKPASLGFVVPGTRVEYSVSAAAQALSLFGLIPGLAWGAALTLMPVILALVLVIRYCGETRGRDLREMEAPT